MAWYVLSLKPAELSVVAEHPEIFESSQGYCSWEPHRKKRGCRAGVGCLGALWAWNLRLPI